MSSDPASRPAPDPAPDTTPASTAPTPRGSVVVTGASSGIGRATAERLAAEGWNVLAVARRAERLEALAEATGVRTQVVDVTEDASVQALARRVEEEFDGRLTALVNIAGGALGVDPVESSDLDQWQTMYATNVLGTARVTQVLLPALRADGHASIVVLSSTAAQAAYEGGVGYNAAKAGEHMIAAGLRLELNGEPIRVIEVAPGMVHTPEFSLVRLGGDQEAADRVYDGVEHPLTAEDCADVITYALQVPHHVNLDLITVRPLAQAAQHKVARGAGL
ncbi:SDR family oxidoreductase [Brachybacterium sp. EF45031]|uniref:SDR family oxidoreductase n=1 Tax=Brachybacterium sillae TaxID=2810536 RepID=UPI00217D4B05|nr:SDR family oxidoreductase [Brachybacterium sillae]MCS6712300.1 SDR family oxidoreductase [Brachybacterium sillae]